MSNTADNTKQYDLPPIGSLDRTSAELLKAGLCQQADGLRQQLQGVHRQISAVDKVLEKLPPKGTG